MITAWKLDKKKEKEKEIRSPSVNIEFSDLKSHHFVVEK